MVEYSRKDRMWLIATAIVGFVGLNGAFLYGMTKPGVFAQAMTNPISLAFIADLMIVFAWLAYLLRKWGVNRLGWGWFVALSFLSGIAFSLPIVLLWKRRSPHE